MASWIVAGACLIGGGMAWRTISRRFGPQLAIQGKTIADNLFQENYKGGFESEMTKYEAGKILGISPNSSSQRIKVRHKKLMFQNHPDRGGSPFIAAKINEAKEYLENPPKNS